MTSCYDSLSKDRRQVFWICEGLNYNQHICFSDKILVPDEADKIRVPEEAYKLKSVLI